MPAAYTELKLTDGTVTADLVDGTNYQLLDNSWAPAVAARRVSKVAGQSPYEDVVEEIALTVIGTTGAVALANLAKLSELLDQAERFWQGDDVDPVLLKCQPQGSTLTAALSAMVMGRPAGSGGLNMPATFNDHLQIFEIEPVVLRLVRGGLWLGTTETPEETTKTVNPFVKSISFAAATAIPSPVDIAITGFNDQSHTVINAGTILVTNDTGHLVVESTGSMVLALNGWTSETDSPNRPTDGAVLRFTPGAPTPAEIQSGELDLTSTAFDTGEQTVGVWASVRVNTTDRVFKLRILAETYGLADETEDVTLTYDDYSTPTWVYLGLLKSRVGIRTIFFISSVDSLTGSPTLDIDAVALMAMDEAAHVINHEGSSALISPFIPIADTDVDIIVEQRSLSDRKPFIGFRELTDVKEKDAGYEGDVGIYLTGSTAVTLWLSTHNQYWRDVNQTEIATTQVGMKAGKRTGYLTPQ